MLLQRLAFLPLSCAAAVLVSISMAEAADPAAAPPTCEADEFRQFDFWRGNWDVKENGERAGANRIEAVLNGCALLESWAGAGKSRGHSLNFYDRADHHWHQTWIDNSGGALYLTGGLENGSMVLSGRRPPRAGSDQKSDTLHRITWTPLDDGRVRQHWEASRDDGKTWTTLFDGYYAKAE